MIVVTPQWPAPRGVRAFSTTRRGGVSVGPFASLNLGDDVGDDPVRVARNRERLVATLKLPEAPRWPRQVHGARVLDASCLASAAVEGDAVFTSVRGVVCAVTTADCLPVLLCDRDARVAAVAHAGWRGLAAGVLENTVAALPARPGALLAWLGPAIGPLTYEVGAEVRERFLAALPAAADAFRPAPSGRWLADLYALARQRLACAGVEDVYGGGLCTHSDAARFFSYRRDAVTGRMATGIWLDPA